MIDFPVNKLQNVQRLEGDACSQIILPRVLGNLLDLHERKNFWKQLHSGISL
jgi:hypothetical protein